MHIRVKALGGRPIIIEVEPTDLIEEIRSKLQDKEGIPPTQQNLQFAGLLLEDGYTLEDYGIENDSIVYLIMRMRQTRITVRGIHPRPCTVEVDLYGFVKDVKAKIQDECGISPDQYRLQYAGQLLEDENTLDDYLIKNGSILPVVFPGCGGF
jgi:ubiquitin C